MILIGFDEHWIGSFRACFRSGEMLHRGSGEHKKQRIDERRDAVSARRS